jgi:ferredoxin/flavodoxin---NADP+ reductase
VNTFFTISERPAAEDIRSLREANYNAAVTMITQVHDDLRIMRVVTDRKFPTFQPGQFVALGLGDWEPRVTGVDEERRDPLKKHRLIKRAYSISCSLFHPSGSLVRVSDCPYLEFYVSLIRHSELGAPALTPRLFALKEGDRLFVASHAAGRYTLEGVQDDNNLLFLATGTGEAPHNAMIAELLARSHQGRIASAVSVRYLQDAAYHVANKELARRYPNFKYLVSTTREPENLDTSHPHFSGKRYLQDLVVSGELEQHAGIPLDPVRTQVFLCGNPAMVGIEQGGRTAPGGMVEVLSLRGFRHDEPHSRGNIHTEHYW